MVTLSSVVPQEIIEQWCIRHQGDLALWIMISVACLVLLSLLVCMSSLIDSNELGGLCLMIAVPFIIILCISNSDHTKIKYRDTAYILAHEEAIRSYYKRVETEKKIDLNIKTD